MSCRRDRTRIFHLPTAIPARPSSVGHDPCYLDVSRLAMTVTDFIRHSVVGIILFIILGVASLLVNTVSYWHYSDAYCQYAVSGIPIPVVDNLDSVSDSRKLLLYKLVNSAILTVLGACSLLYLSRRLTSR